jgi:Flp pilus assembly protein TadG
VKGVRRNSGAAIVEFVAMAPLLLLLLLGLIQAAGAGDFAIKVTNAARAGVQYGAQNHVTAADTAGMQTAATNDANTAGVTAVATYFCQCENVTVTSTCGLAGACSTSHQNLYVKVVVSGTMASLVNYSALPTALQTVKVTQTAIMRVTQ